MHVAAFKFVRESLARIGDKRVVVEYGGRDINGTVRGLFAPTAPNYISIDIVPGPGVDVVADACTWIPPKQPDLIVCCEVLEHLRGWKALVRQASKVLSVDGVLILTCACPPRIGHSSVDGGGLREGEYYGNIDPLDLTAVLDSAGFEQYETTVLEREGDLQVLAWKQVPV